MLKLSKKVDYGLISLMHLARHTDKPHWSAREIGAEYEIPLELLAKVLQKLVQGGLLNSQHGANGGYSLRRTPDTINVAEVIQAIEGHFSLTDCVSEEGFCGQFDKCNVKSPLQRLNDLVVRGLRDITIEQMNREEVNLPAQQSGLVSISIPVERR
ncbi:MAG: Rrf2 family transcriptional regulator [Terriglobia bacterium]